MQSEPHSWKPAIAPTAHFSSATLERSQRPRRGTAPSGIFPLRTCFHKHMGVEFLDRFSRWWNIDVVAISPLTKPRPESLVSIFAENTLPRTAVLPLFQTTKKMAGNQYPRPLSVSSNRDL